MLFTVVLAAASVVYKIQRDNQEITIETDDPDVEVVMKRKGELVRIRDAKTGQTWEYDTLRKQIGLGGQPGGLKLGVAGMTRRRLESILRARSRSRKETLMTVGRTVTHRPRPSGSNS